MRGWAAMRAATRAEKSSRSTARAWPAGRRVASASWRRKEPARRHLLLEEPGGGVLGLRLEGVGADELGEVGGLVGLGGAIRTHLVEVYLAAEGGGLQGCFRASKTSSDYFDSFRQFASLPPLTCLCAKSSNTNVRFGLQRHCCRKVLILLEGNCKALQTWGLNCGLRR